MFDNILTEIWPTTKALIRSTAESLKPSSVIESCTLSVLFLWGKGHNAPNFIHMKLIIHGPVFSHPAMVSPQPNLVTTVRNQYYSIYLQTRASWRNKTFCTQLITGKHKATVKLQNIGYLDGGTRTLETRHVFRTLSNSKLCHINACILVMSTQMQHQRPPALSSMKNLSCHQH